MPDENHSSTALSISYLVTAFKALLKVATSANTSV
jgi:hypothetical protein